MLQTVYNRLYNSWSNYNTRKKLNYIFRLYSSKVEMRQLTKEQEEQIQRYYINLIGRKVDTRWHRLLYSITGHFNHRYMPFDIYHEMLEKLSPWKYIKILDDKNLYRYFFKDFNIPQRIVECSFGKMVCITNRQIVAEGIDSAVTHCANSGRCIVKPSVSSSAGYGVFLVNFDDGIDTISGKPVRRILDEAGRNFLIEKAIVENENLRSLNPSSCNTVRIHTYRDSSGNIQYISSFLRIGRQGEVRDNGGAGGIMVALDSEGKTVGENAWTSKTFSSIECTDNGTSLYGYQVKFLDRMIATAKAAHLCLSHFDLIGWDIAVDENNEAVIIEFNPNPDLRLDQVWFKDSCLGAAQDEILKILRK